MFHHIVVGSNDIERSIFLAYVHDPDGNKLVAIYRAK